MTVEGLLIDIDGVLVVSWKALPGAIETMDWIRSSGLPFRLATNTTTRSRAKLADDLKTAGFDIEPAEILTAPVATADYLRVHHRGKSCFLITKGDVDHDFDGIELVEDNAQVVVIGGAEERFTYDRLNKAFQMLRAGAALVAMHRNLWWLTDDSARLDAGAFIAGLEAATGTTAEVTGKPAPAFFAAGVAALGTEPAQTAMVGDDLVSDIAGAQNAGLIGVLVQTGKFDAGEVADPTHQPHRVIASIRDLPAMVG